MHITVIASGGAGGRGVGGGGAAAGPGGTFPGVAISSCKCVSTTPIGAPIYIVPRAAIPPASPLVIAICVW